MKKKVNVTLICMFLLTMIIVYSAAAANRITQPDRKGDVGMYTSLVLDENGYPVISYHQERNEIDSYPGPGGEEVTEHDLKVLHCNDPYCAGGDESITTPDRGGDVGTHTSLVLDARGNPVVSYHDSSDGALKLMHCNDPNCAGDDESIQTPDARRVAGQWSSLKLDDQGNPVVAYHASGTLRVLHCNDPLCKGGDESINAPDFDGGEFVSMVLDDNGYPVISYRGAAGRRLKLMHCNDKLCGAPVEAITFPGIDRVCMGTSLTLDATGNPIISYVYRGSQYILHCNDPDCRGGDESNTGPFLTDVGADNSMALDADGNPVVSAWVLDNPPDESAGHLEILRCNDPYCDGIGERVTSPDSEGNPGQYSSIAIDRSGDPVVSYYGRDRANLKLLHCDTPTCGYPVGPDARFTADRSEGKQPVTVHFEQQSTGDFDECLWEFGDGSSANGCSSQGHRYEDAGLFTVSLTVSGWAGSDTYKCRGCINVFENVMADFTASPAAGPPPLFVSYQNLSTGDYDSCIWDFGDGHGSLDCANVTHVYPDVGKYTVKLTVIGNGGRNTKIVRDAVIVHKGPLAEFEASPTSGPPPLVVTFEDKTIGIHDECIWDFGDGKPQVKGEKVSHTYRHEGSYTVTMTASGSTGSDTIKKKDFVVVEPYRSYIPGVLAR